MQAIPRISERLRRGSIIVLAAICLVIVVAFLAFSIDFGYIAVTESELQNAADAGAISGTRALWGGSKAAITAAHIWAGKNQAAGDAVTELDVEIGVWNDDTAAFNLIPAGSSQSSNAVRVTCYRTAERNNPLNLFFAPLLDRKGFGPLYQDNMLNVDGVQRTLTLLGTDSTNLTVSAIAATTLTCGGFVGIEGADVNGFTDSYDSRQGSYDSQTPGNEGHVCSNKNIIIKAAVNGNASPGSDYDVTIQSDGMVSGSTDSHMPLVYPLAESGDAPFSNDNDLIPVRYWKNSMLSIPTSQVVEYPGGTIYAKTVSINGKLRILGPTTIYIETTAIVAGEGIVNVSQIPSVLKIILLN